MYFCSVNLLAEQIFSITTEEHFNEIALQIFRYQAINCELYKNYIGHLHINPLAIKHYTAIPFLPIGFFKSHAITSNTNKSEIIFSSSGTTGQITSKHLVSDVKIYEQSFNKAFHLFYQKPAKW